ncbi:patatin-like phospholipase family protein [Candidatus Colwellia aromaticivorans]|uniref:patatin-like phospholipase family protein n=1 Tax=Candidatus Colwellia aromaticivorans TaxID=2267621 RepID=UPI000DF31692|nr:patatin-like phospholipase family protein [Candidatus Colwellia aromaticivorans]
MELKGKRVSLVLGSGGARGLAHIGIIYELEKSGCSIQSISGCSAGALIGAVYAAGKLDAFEEWVCELTKVDVMSLLDISWSSGGIVKGDRIINKLIDIVGDILIEDLPISFTAVAADVNNEKEVWLTSGRLFDAVRASISLPLFFTPVNYKGSHLIDGGVLNPVPIAPSFNDDTELTIAVNLAVSIEHDNHFSNSFDNKVELTSPIGKIQNKIKNFIRDLSENPKVLKTRDWGAYNIANQAFDAMQSTIARQKYALYHSLK